MAVNRYKALSAELLESEIAREEDERERLETALRAKRTDFLRLGRERESARSRLDYWREQRRLARVEAREARERLPAILARVRGLEREVEALRRRLPYAGVYERATIERLIAGFESEVAVRWREWADVMRRLRMEIYPRQREAEARYRRELRGFRRVSEEARRLRMDVRREEAERSAIERELELKYEARVRYKIVEYTKYFEVIVRRPRETPPIRFELRGEFTIPGRLVNADPKVIEVVEAKLTEAFREWGQPQMRRVFVSDIEYALAMTRGEPPEQFERRVEGGWWKTAGPYGGIELENYAQPRRPAPTYGEEEVAVTDKFVERVDVTIVKYINMETVGGPWVVTVTVKEEEFT